MVSFEIQVITYLCNAFVCVHCCGLITVINTIIIVDVVVVDIIVVDDIVVVNVVVIIAVIIAVIISTWQESSDIMRIFFKSCVPTFWTIFAHDCKSQKSPSPQK